MDRLVAPDNFTGDLTRSYSLQLSVQVQLPQNASLRSAAPTVEICGPGGVECLVGEFQVDYSNQGLLLLTVSDSCCYGNYLSIFCRYHSVRCSGDFK